MLIGSVAITALAALGGASQAPGSGEGLALQEAYRWVRFGLADGLPDERVTLVVEALDGTPWVATRSGVAYYDGYRWQRALGLPDTSVADICGDASGRVVVITHEGAWAGGREGFEEVPIASKCIACEALPEGGVTILIDEIGHRNPRFMILSDGLREGGSVPRIDEMTSPAQGLAGSVDGGGPWFSSPAGLFRWTSGQWIREGVHDAEDFTATAMQANGAGIAYVLHPAEQRGLWQWRDGVFEHVELRPGQVSRQLAVAPNGNALAVMHTREILMRRGDEWTTLDHLPREFQASNSVCFRRNGDLWVAGDAGLYLYRASHPFLELWDHEVGGVPSLALEYLEASDGSIWIGTTAGVERRIPDGRSRVHDRIGDTDLHTVTGLAEDTGGNVWISSGSGDLPGAWRWDGEEWTHFGVAQGLPARAIHKIRCDRAGRLWFLTLSLVPGAGDASPGAYVLDDGAFESWTADRGLETKAVYAFAEAPDGTLWFGTRRGLSRWRAGTWRHWRTNQPNGVRDRVFTLDVDEAGRVWFGHQSSFGLGTIDADDTVRYDAAAFGDHADGVAAVHFGPSGKLWLATRAGVHVRIDGRWTGFGKDEGLQTNTILELLPLTDRVLTATGFTTVVNLEAARAHPPLARIEPDPLGEYAGLQRWSVDSWWGSRTRDRVPTRFRFDAGPWSPWSLRRHAPDPELAAGAHTFEVQTRSVLNSAVGSGVSRRFVVARPDRPNPFLPIGVVALVFATMTAGVLFLARRRSERRLLEISEQRYRSLVESVPVAIVIREAGRIVFANPAAARLVGAASPRDLIGASFLDYIHPDSRDLARKRLESGEAGYDGATWVEEKLLRADGEMLHAEVAGSRVRFDGRPAIQVIARDVSELHRHRERQELMTRELDHRVKNTLAGVLAIAQQSMDAAGGFEEFSQSFTGRVRAMARTHEALAAKRWGGVQTEELLELALGPLTKHWTGLLEMEGPSLLIRAQAATPLATALHELVTNATKYGALSVADGRLRVTLTVEGDAVGLTWQERGGPPIEVQPGAGLGLSLVRGMIEYELGGTARFEFEPEGFTCTIRIGARGLLLGATPVAGAAAATRDVREPAHP